MPIHNLIPLHDLQIVTVSDTKTMYRSTGIDPCFDIELPEFLKKGLYRINISIESCKGRIRAPKIYFDIGKGYNEEQTILLPPIIENTIQSLLYFPEDIVNLRFDPTILKDAEFRIEYFEIEPANKTKPLLQNNNNAIAKTIPLIKEANIEPETNENLKKLLLKTFDKDYYLSNYPDIKISNRDPFEHYFSQGWREGRKPNDWFNPLFYVEANPDIKELNVEPLTHYLRIGKAEGRSIRKSGKAYFDYINQHNISEEYKNEYTEYTKYEKLDVDLKLIAFYLPQYHPIPENDEAWGKGFTEWTNVSKALPQFEEHYQPRLPGELGYYDLRLIDIQKRQIELAKNYGLYGFCYHYYWFAGKKIMDRPIQQLLDNPELDFPFCINWANENWTKKWDGLENEVILKQSHSPSDDIQFLDTIKPILTDTRYIKVNNKPLLMIYRPQLFPDIKATIRRWREHAKKIGIGEIYLVLTHSFDLQDPREIGFDAATEFAPNGYPISNITATIKTYNPNFAGQIYDYYSAINHSSSRKEQEYTKFRGVCPSWDNTARKPGNGNTLHNASPTSYMRWLEFLCYNTEEYKAIDEKIIFINAWNEWAEGAYLEPDRKYGYANLDVTYNVLKKFDKRKQIALKNTQKIKKKSDIAVIIHLYYTDLWKELKNELANFKEPFDLYININNSASVEDIELIKKDYPDVHIYAFENRGRDILPFLKTLDIMLPLGYKYVCKLHSKKSLHREDGSDWRKTLIQGIIGSPEKIKQSIDALNKEDVGVVVAKGNLFSYRDWVGSNVEIVENLAKKANIKIPEDFLFPAGSIFWFSPRIFKGTEKLVHADEFPVENGQIDGTIAHAYERIVGLLCAVHKCKIECI